MSLIVNGLKVSKEAFQLHQLIKERNTGQVVDKNACEKIVYTFVKEGQMDGPGTHAGACGTKKDHKRVFCCPSCFHKNWK